MRHKSVGVRLSISLRRRCSIAVGSLSLLIEIMFNLVKSCSYVTVISYRRYGGEPLPLAVASQRYGICACP